MLCLSGINSKNLQDVDADNAYPGPKGHHDEQDRIVGGDAEEVRTITSNSLQICLIQQIKIAALTYCFGHAKQLKINVICSDDIKRQI